MAIGVSPITQQVIAYESRLVVSTTQSLSAQVSTSNYFAGSVSSGTRGCMSDQSNVASRLIDSRLCISGYATGDQFCTMEQQHRTNPTDLSNLSYRELYLARIRLACNMLERHKCNASFEHYDAEGPAEGPAELSNCFPQQRSRS